MAEHLYIFDSCVSVGAVCCNIAVCNHVLLKCVVRKTLVLPLLARTSPSYNQRSKVTEHSFAEAFPHTNAYQLTSLLQPEFIDDL